MNIMKIFILVFITLFYSCAWETHEWLINYNISGTAESAHVNASVFESNDLEIDINAFPWEYQYNVSLSDSDERIYRVRLDVIKTDLRADTFITVRLYVRGAIVSEITAYDDKEIIMEYECNSYE